MRVYCKCLNIQLEFDTLETRPKSFCELTSDIEDCPAEVDHELFRNLLYAVPIKAQKDLTVAQDDIIKRRIRDEAGEKPGTFAIYAYLPKLVLTHRKNIWRIQECFLCHTPVMASFPNGTAVICPDNLLGMSSDDGLHTAQMSTSARFWMLSRTALAKDNKVSEDIQYSSQVKKQLESMSTVWHIAKIKAQEDMRRRIEELRRQEEAAFEEMLRTSAELQRHVTNSYLSLLTLKQSDPSAYTNDEKWKEERGTDDLLEKLTEQIRLESNQPAGDMPEHQSRKPEHPRSRSSPKSHGEVEMATDALDFSESDLFDDFRMSPPPFARDSEEMTVGRVIKEDNDLEKTEADNDGDILSTSAISSSMKAGRGMRAMSRRVDDRLPDTDAFNAMTDAEKAYAIERASYQLQDNRLHELYGDMEPPHLRDLRRQAEQARQHHPIDNVGDNPTAISDRPQTSDDLFS